MDYQGDLTLKLPDNFKTLPDDEQAQVKHHVARSIILHLYELNTAKVNPRLTKVFHCPHGRTRWEPIHFASDTWHDDILPLGESLIRIER